MTNRVRAGEPCSEAYTNRIHRDDCAGVLRHLTQLDRPLPLYLGADHEPATQCSVMDWIAGRLGLPAPARAASGSPGAGTAATCASSPAATRSSTPASGMAMEP